QTVHRVQEGRLAATRGADDCHELTLAQLEIDAVDGQERAAGALAPVVDGHSPGLELDRAGRYHRRIHDQRSRVIRFSAGSGPMAGGNSSIHSQGRVASMTTRELKPFSP